MYRITRKKPTWESASITDAWGGLKSVCISVEPECLSLKARGARTWFRLPYRDIFELAIRAHIAAVQKAKAAKSKPSSKRTRRVSIKRGAL